MIGEVLRHLTQRPATVAYPAEPSRMPQDYRGKIQFLAEKCVGCKLCQKDCPSNALVINKVGDKRFEAVFQLDKCIFCAQCVDSCNKDAMASTLEYELATLDRNTLRVVFHAPEAPPAPAPKPAAEAAPAAAAAPAAPQPAAAPAEPSPAPAPRAE
jgi:formate hydrogenlyase subunit 6/NADH:ubiquinone oxidoreductase subunit I